MIRFWMFTLALGIVALGISPPLFSAGDGPQAPGGAPAHDVPQASPESGPVPILESSGELGSLSFFLDKENPTRGGESVHLQEKDGAFFCLTLNAEDRRLRRAVKYLRGIEITLEGPGDSLPHLAGGTRWKKRALTPDEKGCYIGFVRIPFGTEPGKFQVTEIDLWQTSGHTVALRAELGQISPMGGIEVASPMTDRKPPIVEKIVSYTPRESKINFSFHRAWLDIRFRVIATDLLEGIKPESFRVFMKAFIDGNLVDILEPRCVARLPNLYYDCHLYFSRAAPHLRARTVKFVLDSISLTDKAGNDIEITQPSELAQLTEGRLLRYRFFSAKSVQKGSPEEEEEEENGGDLMKGDTQPPQQEENHPKVD